MRAIKTIIKKYQEIANVEIVSIISKLDSINTKEDTFKVNEIPEELLRKRVIESNATLKDSNHLYIKR